MEEDQVRFDAERLQVDDALLQMPGEKLVEARKVLLARGIPFECVMRRFVSIERVVLRKHAQPHFVEWRRPKGPRCLQLELFALVNPGIASGPDTGVTRPVHVGKWNVSSARTGP